MTTARHAALPPSTPTDHELLRGARIANFVMIVAVAAALVVLGLGVANLWPPKRSLVDVTVVEPQ